MSSNHQIITNYNLHPNPTDTTTLIPHVEEHKTLYQQTPETITADAGYGSEENYAYLEEIGIEAFVKFGTFDKEQKKSCTEKLLPSKPIALQQRERLLHLPHGSTHE